VTLKGPVLQKWEIRHNRTRRKREEKCGKKERRLKKKIKRTGSEEGRS
jgi:hypothetical protein